MRRAVALLLFALPLFGRTIHWKSIDVEAHLDRDGNLRIVERQQMVFDGDWNGGERNFGVRPRQRFHVLSMAREEDGRKIPMQRGSLEKVDHYDVVSDGVLRWRSRLPSDPPFANRELTYVIEATYWNILEHEGGKSFQLSHDFGMPQREGIVERFTLHFDADPIWNMVPVAETRANQQPGENVIIARQLTYTGDGFPSGVDKPLPFWVGLLALLLFAGGATLLIRAFREDERRTGRFEPVVSQFAPELLELKAEVAGAAWDVSIGAPEVAATLARMAAEKKISTHITGDVLHMHLKVPRDSLLGYERMLVDALFFDGRIDTSTEAVKDRYKSRGFNPAQLIEHKVKEELTRIPGWSMNVKRFTWGWHVLTIGLAGLFLLISAFFGDADFPVAFASGMVMTLFGLIASITAWFKAKAVVELRSAFAAVGVLLGIPALSFLTGALSAPRSDVHAPVLFTIPLWQLAWLHLVLNLLKIRQAPTVIAYRKRIAGARQYFKEQLELAQPELRDEWFPYILAFGLGTNVDRWFRAFGGQTTHGSSMSSWSFSSSSSSSSSASSWTGGGGAFGGAGATGSWALAAGAMAAGVASPSSSGGSGGGGGGGGGSSSGGGGGGGW